MTDRLLTRVDWAIAAVGTVVTTTFGAWILAASGVPYWWVYIPVTVVGYPLSGWALNRAADWYVARRREDAPSTKRTR